MKGRFSWLVGLEMLGMLGFGSFADATIQLPFPKGETWYVCRGYNLASHADAPALDLSTDPHSPVQGGCSIVTASTSATTSQYPRIVVAPKKGHISYGGENDFVCVSFDDGSGSVYIGHLTDRASQGPIGEGDKVGEVAPPSVDVAIGNHGYAHIHIQAHPIAGCPKGNLVPFTGDMRFEGAPDLPWDHVTPNQWSGQKLPALFLPGTLVRIGNQLNVYLVSMDDATGKLVLRWVKSEKAMTDNVLSFADVISITPAESACYPLGSDIAGAINGHALQEGEVVWLNGGSAVFVVSGGMLFHLKMSADEFRRLGYIFEEVRNVTGSYPGGRELTFQDLTRSCQANSGSALTPGTQLIGGCFVDSQGVVYCPNVPVLSLPKKNGEASIAAKDCASGFSFPGPDGLNYCIAADKSCGLAGTDGLKQDQTTWYAGQEYQCVAGNVYIPVTSVPKKNGEVCAEYKNCFSGFCFGGPDGKNYCIDGSMSCGFPGTEGVRQNEVVTFNGQQLRCVSGNVYVPANAPTPRSVPEGAACRLGQDPSDCGSNCCWRFVDGRGYCINERKTCALPGTGGLSVNETTCFQGIRFECRPDPANLTPIGSCP